MKLALVLLLACDASSGDLLNSTVPVGTVLDGLCGLEGFGVLPVLQVLVVLTLGDPVDGFLGFFGENLLY